MKCFLLSALFVFVGVSACAAQTSTKVVVPKPAAAQLFAAAKSSPAYAELLLRRTERESELEELLLDHTEEFPKIKEIRFELDLIQKEMTKVLTVNTSDAAKLTLALGKLLVRKTELETDLWNLKRQYNDEHPEVKRARRKVEVFDHAIKEILP